MKEHVQGLERVPQQAGTAGSVRAPCWLGLLILPGKADGHAAACRRGLPRLEGVPGGARCADAVGGGCRVAREPRACRAHGRILAAGLPRRGLKLARGAPRARAVGGDGRGGELLFPGRALERGDAGVGPRRVGLGNETQPTQWSAKLYYGGHKYIYVCFFATCSTVPWLSRTQKEKHDWLFLAVERGRVVCRLGPGTRRCRTPHTCDQFWSSGPASPPCPRHTARRVCRSARVACPGRTRSNTPHICGPAHATA